MSSKELLAEYAKLAAKLEHINETLQEMNAVDIAQLIDKIRVVERKMSLVYTLFKQSVYSITMQNAQHDQDLHSSQSQDPDTKPSTEVDEQQYQNITPQSQQSQSQDHRRYSQEQQQYQTQSQQSDYDSPPQSQTQQPLRSSLRTSNNENISNQQPTSILRNSTYRPATGTTTATTGTGTSRMSNAREEYQAATGNKSILALSRGQEGRSRWGNHYGYHSGSGGGGGGGGSGGFDSENHTNRPRYH
ncbi:hypothetical protein EC957_003993 [Mortierella hygrophila]|uniref:DASH complex subunit DAD3 n=1 Tax=Mortierella hygrophila TaxID=979708 RepID=A0A9P6F215_9FUNG|nr:hypothetical protein EC957_003993 [Mortierella hygrophila]